MPKVPIKYPHVVSVRLTDGDWRELAALAAQAKISIGLCARRILEEELRIEND